MRWHRTLAALALATSLSVAIGCSADDQALGPTGAPEQAPPSALVTSLVGNLRLLSCSPQQYAVTTRTIGAAGGVVTVGTHRLVIPAGALAGPVTIKAEQLTARVNSVRFSPEGLRFAKPATLTLSYSNCSPLLVTKRVVYTDELLRILELLPSLDSFFSKSVSAPIRHFSRYAVAW